MRFMAALLISALVFSSDATWLRAHFEKGNDKKHMASVQEINLLFYTSLKIYRNFISSQDSHTCNFTLSCSHFAEDAVKRYGLFIGLLMASDRLQRCVAWSRSYYPRDPISGLAIDYPIEYYLLK